MDDRVQGSAVILREGSGYVLKELYGAEVVGRSADPSELFRNAQDHLPPEGGEIVFGTGRFSSPDTFAIVKDNVAVRGAGRATILQCTSAQREAVVSAYRVSGASVAGLAVIGTSTGPTNGLVLTTVLACVARNVFVSRFRERGIILREDSALTRITSCTVADCGVAGISLLGLARVNDVRYGDFVPNLLSDNVVWRGGTGVELRNAIVTNISGCAVYQCDGPAFLIADDSNSLCMTGCRSFQTRGDALVVRDSHEMTIVGNVFCWQEGAGITVEDANWGTICGNSVIDTGSSNPGGPDRTTGFGSSGSTEGGRTGIALASAAGYSVSGNAIFNWGVAPPMQDGVAVDGSSEHVIVTGNTINYYTGDAVTTSSSNSKVETNDGAAGPPFRHLPGLDSTFIQTFQPEIGDRLIGQMAADPPQAPAPLSTAERTTIAKDGSSRGA